MLRPITLAALLATPAFVASCDSIAVAKSDRTLTAAHVERSGVLIETRNGAVSVGVDRSRADVLVEASIVAGGRTQQEADERLALVGIAVNRGADGRLEIRASFPEPAQSRDGVSFSVKVPNASGVVAKSSNGRLEIAGIDGPVSVSTSNGRVTVADIGGSVKATSSNGAIDVQRVRGEVEARSSNGAVVVTTADGPITVETSNGRVELADVGGPITADTSNGAVKLVLREGFPGTLDAKTSNGSVSYVGGTQVISAEVGKKSALLTFAKAGSASRVRSSNGSIVIEVK